MRRWIGRKLMRLALRMLGFEPTRTVAFSHESWNPVEVARWSVTVAKTVATTPADVMVLMPLESAEEFDAALARWHDLHPIET